MRKLIIPVCILLITMMFPVSESAAKIVKIDGSHAPAEIKHKCDAVGATYSNSKGSGYSCYDPHKHIGLFCDPKGNCTAIVPPKAPSSIFGLPLGRQSAKSGGSGKSDGSSMTRKHSVSSNQSRGTHP